MPSPTFYFNSLVKSAIDYPPYYSIFVTLPKCIFRCDYCYSKDIVEDKTGIRFTINDIIDYISKANRKFRIIQAIVVSGGEPLLYQNDLIEFFEVLKIKFPYLKLRIDTTLALNIDKRLYDYLDGIAVTIKPISIYKDFRVLKNNLSAFPEFEFSEIRLTIHKNNYEEVFETFLNVKDLISENSKIRIIPAVFLGKNHHFGSFDYFTSEDEIGDILNEFKYLFEDFELIVDFENVKKNKQIAFLQSLF